MATKKVKMLAGFIGPTVKWPKGSIQELDDAEAQRLIDAGRAEPVAGRKKSSKKETATIEQPETAVID